ncbi:MAG: TolC family protein [Pseudomonadota bacterium]
MTCSSLHAAELSLTLAESQRLALQRSRLPASHDFAADAARHMAIAAAQLPDPVLKAGIDNLPVSGADRFSPGDDFMTMRRIGIAQELTSQHKRSLRAAVFEREAELSGAARNAAAREIARDAALAWIDAYHAGRMATLAAEQVTQARNESEAAGSAYRAGRASQADLFTARSALAMAEDRASESGRRLRNAQSMLARWTGIAAGPEMTLAEPPPTDSIRLDPAALSSQLEHHPQVALLARQEDIARAETRLAEANTESDWSVELAFQQRGRAWSNMVSVGISVPLQWDRPRRQDREVAAKLALAGQAQARREEALRAHEAETRGLIAEWENNRERHARFVRELLPLAHERIAAALAAYRGGKATLNELLAARRNELDVRLQALQLEMDIARLWAQLDFLAPDEHAATILNKEAK